MIFSYSNDWVFQFAGSQFPAGNIFLTFSGPASVYVDYGDGNGATFASGTVNRIFFGADDTYNTSANYPRYLYSTGNASTIRTARIRINQPELLVSLQISNALNRSQPFPVKFSRLINLQTLNLSGMLLTDIDTSLLQLRNLNYLSFRNAFASDTRYHAAIPLDVIAGKKYTTFGWQPGLGGKSFASSNLDKLAVELGPTLQTLVLDSNTLRDTNGADGPLPANFSSFGVLSYLALNNNQYTTFPAIVNSIVSLTNLEFGSNPLTTWGDLSGLVNLSAWNISSVSASSLPPAVPVYLSNFTKLKVFQFTACFGNSTGLEAFIASFYNFLIARASITGTASLPFRGMSITCGSETTGFVVSGIEQPPAGYVQGAGNGTPANCREMIYVMKNQYGHNWNYRMV